MIHCAMDCVISNYTEILISYLVTKQSCLFKPPPVTTLLTESLLKRNEMCSIRSIGSKQTNRRSILRTEKI